MLAAHLREQALVFRRGFGVAPELGRAQHCALLIEQDQTVLLAGDANAEDRLAVDVRRLQGLAGGADERVEPLLNVLFAAAVGATDHRVWRRAQTEHLAAAGIEDDRFGALGAAVDTQEELCCCHVWACQIALKIKSYPLTPALSPMGARGKGSRFSCLSHSVFDSEFQVDE